jgi:hypothetical protein
LLLGERMPERVSESCRSHVESEPSKRLLPLELALKLQGSTVGKVMKEETTDSIATEEMSEPQMKPAVSRARFIPPYMVASCRNLVDCDPGRETEPLYCIHTVVVAFY